MSEPLSPGLRRVWDVAEVLWSGRTAYQDVLVGRTAHGVNEVFPTVVHYGSDEHEWSFLTGSPAALAHRCRP